MAVRRLSRRSNLIAPSYSFDDPRPQPATERPSGPNVYARMSKFDAQSFALAVEASDVLTQ